MASVPAETACPALLICSVLFCSWCATARAQDQGELHPFVLPWDDATPSATNLSHWNHTPAGKFGHVRAGADGHLYVGDQRIRLFGVDLAFSGNIPQKEDAPKVAARMAKFGINIVRFHIMDMARFPRGILAEHAEDTRSLDPEGLDRLDYFIAQLKQAGVYVDLNTLTYRYINRHDGLSPEIEEMPRAQDRNIVGFFHEPALELQKEYARKLLTHRNPYTGMTYTEDPAVAFVEIHNENGLLHAWLGGLVDDVPKVFLSDLQGQWNEWLVDRYGTTDRLGEAWGRTAEPLGRELLTNADLSEGLERWYLETPHNAQATAEIVDDVPAPLQGARSVRVTVTKPPESGWPIRFQQNDLPVREGRSVTVSFWARADEPVAIRVGIEEGHAPWRRLGFPATADLTDQWRQFRFVFTANADDDKTRLIFDEHRSSGVLEIAGISLREGGVAGLRDGERTEDGTVPIFLPGSMGERTLDAQRDWMRFLWETEDAYWRTMQDYLKDDLGVKALVIGTVIGCSTPNLMAAMDCTDAHAYWTHPEFPNRPWDQNDWFVRNVPMVNRPGGNLSGIALRRVLGKPHCVTEYGHAAPNTYGGEANLLYASYASLQDWDYLSLSRYSHRDDWDVRRIWNWFDFDQSPVRLVGLVPAMAMFRRGDVQPARQQIVAELGREMELERLRASGPWSLVSAGEAGVAEEAALLHRVAIATEGQSPPEAALRPEEVPGTGDRFVSDTGELVWDVSTEGRGMVTVNTPMSKAVIGFGGGETFDLGGVVIEPGDTRQDGFSAITVTVMEGQLPLPDAAVPTLACRLLITATGHSQNTGWGWEELGDDRVTLRRNWGEPPTLVEVIPARITLPLPAEDVQAWALDERGQRDEEMPVGADADGRAVLTIGPPHRTLWYEVVAR
ncbi:MAG: carbohydrate binding domain-containing protein [Candidatus Brocadiae bacterium]|nr:carbohydrate binding domain-containing protein [Candidatus Brocadiia bacterium]